MFGMRRNRSREKLVAGLSPSPASPTTATATSGGEVNGGGSRARLARLVRHRRSHSHSSGLNVLPPEWPHPDASIPSSERAHAIEGLRAMLPPGAAVNTDWHVQQALNFTNWSSLNAAVEYLEDWSDAVVGVLAPPDRNIPLRGVENSGNTCFIDSLIFALFARMDAVDPWLVQNLDVPTTPRTSTPSVSRPVTPASNPTIAATSFPTPAPESVPHTPAKLTDQVASPIVTVTPPQTSEMQPSLPPMPAPTPLLQSNYDTQRASLVRNVQVHLTLLATRLRKGHLVTRAEVRMLEADIKRLWAYEGTNSGLLGVQEDVAELFLLLASCLRAPSLPLWQVIHHGAGVEDVDDKRVCTERCLQLAIPDPKAKEPIMLEKLLEEFFFDNRVMLMRKIAASELTEEERRARKGAAEAEREERWRLGLPMLSQDRIGRQDSAAAMRPAQEQLVEAWSMLRLMPFLVGESESGEQSEVVLTESTPIVVPIMLKRYYRKESTGVLKRTSRQVLVPVEIAFDQFTEAGSSADAPSGPSYSLVLQSVICHLGDTPTSGHFITYVNANSSLAGRFGTLSRRGSLATPTPSTSGAQEASLTSNESGLPPPYSPGALPSKKSSSATEDNSQPPISPSLKPMNPPLASAPASPASLSRSYSTTAADRAGAPPSTVTSSTASTAQVSPPSIDDGTPVWLRFDGLPTTNKVQTLTSTASITRAFMDEVAKNAYLCFYELRRTEPPPQALRERFGSSASVPPQYTAAAPDPATSPQGPPKLPTHTRRGSAQPDTADLALAFKLQAKEARKVGKHGECIVM